MVDLRTHRVSPECSSPSPERRGLSCPFPKRDRSIGGKKDTERGSFAGSALHLKLEAHQIAKRTANRKTQSAPAGSHIRFCFELEKRFENLLEVTGRNSNPSIADIDPSRLKVDRIHNQLHFHFSLLGKFQSIIDQVYQYLLEFVLIHQNRCYSPWNRNFDLNLTVLPLAFKLLADLAHDRIKTCRNVIQLEAACFDSGKSKDRVTQWKVVFRVYHNALEKIDVRGR